MSTAINLINICLHVLVAESCPTLCNRMDYSPPGSSVHGILQLSYMQCSIISSGHCAALLFQYLFILKLEVCAFRPSLSILPTPYRNSVL